MTCLLCAQHRARHGELAEQAARLLADERPDVRAAARVMREMEAASAELEWHYVVAHERTIRVVTGG